MRLGILIMSFLVLGSMACSHDDGGNKSGGKVQITDATDRSQCGNGTATSIEGTWSFTARGNNGAQVVASYAIGRNSTTLTFQCSAGGRSAEGSTTSPSSYTSNQFTILSSSSNSSASCPVSLEAGTVSYQFSGSCLQINDGQNSLILVPRGGNHIAQAENHGDGQASVQSQSQLNQTPDFQIPEMPKMPKMPEMPKAPKFPSDDSSDDQ